MKNTMDTQIFSMYQIFSPLIGLNTSHDCPAKSGQCPNYIAGFWLFPHDAKAI